MNSVVEQYAHAGLKFLPTSTWPRNFQPIRNLGHMVSHKKKLQLTWPRKPKSADNQCGQASQYLVIINVAELFKIY